jgi:hypothetical protein
MTALPAPLERCEYAAAALTAGFMPALSHANKPAVLQTACPCRLGTIVRRVEVRLVASSGDLNGP